MMLILKKTKYHFLCWRLQNKWFFVNILIEVRGVNTAEIENLKTRVNIHKNNLLTKKRLLKEQEEWQSMFNEVEEMVFELKKQYNNTKSDDDKAKLDSWLKEEQDYINVLDEYTHDINEINIELNVYRDEDYRIELNFIERITRYNDNVKKIKEIEDISSKALSTYPASYLLTPEGVLLSTSKTPFSCSFS